jgi:hypothetical protein
MFLQKSRWNECILRVYRVVCCPSIVDASFSWDHFNVAAVLQTLGQPVQEYLTDFVLSVVINHEEENIPINVDRKSFPFLHLQSHRIAIIYTDCSSVELST